MVVSLLAGLTTETEVDPGCSGVKLVMTVSAPPKMTTDPTMVPFVASLLFTVTVTDCPPATCWTAAKLLSGLSCAIEIANVDVPAATVVEKKGVPNPSGGAMTGPEGVSDTLEVRNEYPGALAVYVGVPELESDTR